MTYKVIMKEGYRRLVFKFNSGMEALAFMEKASETREPEEDDVFTMWMECYNEKEQDWGIGTTA